VGTRPNTQEDERADTVPDLHDQYLPYPLTPTLQVNSQPQAIGAS
jgi:hypothetical protein